MEIVELKAKAYDIISQIEYLQKLLQETNQQIAVKMQEQEAKKGGE
jgi:hypothetical protein